MTRLVRSHVRHDVECRSGRRRTPESRVSARAVHRTRDGPNLLMEVRTCRDDEATGLGASHSRTCFPNSAAVKLPGPGAASENVRAVPHRRAEQRKGNSGRATKMRWRRCLGRCAGRPRTRCVTSKQCDCGPLGWPGPAEVGLQRNSPGRVGLRIWQALGHTSVAAKGQPGRRIPPGRCVPQWRWRSVRPRRRVAVAESAELQSSSLNLICRSRRSARRVRIRLALRTLMAEARIGVR